MEKLTLDSEVMVTWYDQGYDDDFDGYTKGASRKCVTVRELYFEHCKDARDFEGSYEPIYNQGDLDVDGNVDDDKFQAAWARGLEAYEQGLHGDIVEDVIQYFCEGDLGYVMSMEEYTKQEKEKEMRQMESLASKYAKMWGCTAGSYAFVELLTSAIQDLDYRYECDMGYECKAERWAACQYAGATESFWSDEDFIKGRYSDMYDELNKVMQWLDMNCPLLMACVREKQLAEGKEELV